MALNGATHFELRTTGDDTNGGGFNTGASGTDYSQQDSPQVTYTDLVIGGTTTQLTSAANPFTSAHVGNIINITSGTGFTVGRYQVNSVAGVTATMDRAVGTAASTGGNGKLGGALATYGLAVSLPVAENVIHIKAGTYTLTSVATLASVNFSLIGYETTRLDGGVRPLITCATNSVHLNLSYFGSSATHNWTNLNFSHTATTRGGFIDSATANPTTSFTDCTFTGFSSWGVNWMVAGGGPLLMVNCTVTGFTANAITSTQATLINCRIIDNAADGLYHQSSGQYATAIRCIFANNGGNGMKVNNGGIHVRAIECTFANNAAVGLWIGISSLAALPYVVFNNIFYGNGTYGLLMPAVFTTLEPRGAVVRYNAFGANTTADRFNLTAQTGDVTLTADPFTDSAARDYSLNPEAGGGAACRGAGVQPE